MARIIYADNAATTQLNKTAIEVMKPFWLYEYANPSQPYSFSRKVKNALKEARNTIAECINALPNEIYFTSGGTESDNWAIKGTAFLNYERKAVITSVIEHHAILNSCKFIEKQRRFIYNTFLQFGIHSDIIKRGKGRQNYKNKKSFHMRVFGFFCKFNTHPSRSEITVILKRNKCRTQK